MQSDTRDLFVDHVKSLRDGFTTMNRVLKANRREPDDTRRLMLAEATVEGALRDLEEMAAKRAARADAETSFILSIDGELDPTKVSMGRALAQSMADNVRLQNPGAEVEIVVFTKQPEV